MADVGELTFIYRRLVGARVRSDLQYRTSFWMFFAGQFLVTFGDFVAIAILFSQVDQLAGWSLAEVAFLYGLTGVSFALADLAISQVESVGERIKLGNFDLLLIRPLGSLFQLAADDFALRRLGNVLQAAVVLTIAIMVSFIPFSMPLIMAAMPTRLATPRMMPSMVRNDLNLCDQTSLRPTIMVFRKFIC